jgi:hypothetical protein
MRMGRPRTQFAESYIPEPNTGCWLWTRGCSADGYGTGNRSQYAHRWSYELANGPIPAGMYVLHRCDTPACVNPGHLFLGTALDNMRDMIAKGRARPSTGERHGHAKLSAGQVTEMRALYPSLSKEKLAKRFGVTATQVRNIVSGRHWRQLAAQTAPPPVGG